MKFIKSLLLLALIIAMPVHAQDGSLLHLLKLAIESHPDVLSHQGELRAAEAELDGAKWARYPGLILQADGYANTPSSAVAPIKTLSVQQPLWAGGRITSKIDRAQASLEVAQAGVVEAQQTVLRDTAVAFHDVLRFEDRLKEARNNEVEHVRLYGVIDRRVEAGVSPKTDLTQAASRLQQAVADRIQVARQLETAQAQLEQMVGRKVSVLTRSTDLVVDSSNQAATLDQAREFSPELKKLQLQIQVADADVEFAQAQLMPQLFAGYRQNLGAISVGQDRGTSYLSLQAQTGGGLSAVSGVQAAVARKQAAIDKVATQERTLQQQVRSTIGDIEAYGLQLKPLKRLVADSDEIVASYLRQFQVGKRTWIEVLNAQREKSQAAFSLSDLDASLNLAKVRLLLLVGQVNAESLGGKT